MTGISERLLEVIQDINLPIQQLADMLAISKSVHLLEHELDKARAETFAARKELSERPIQYVERGPSFGIKYVKSERGPEK